MILSIQRALTHANYRTETGRCVHGRSLACLHWIRPHLLCIAGQDATHQRDHDKSTTIQKSRGASERGCHDHHLFLSSHVSNLDHVAVGEPANMGTRSH